MSYKRVIPRDFFNEAKLLKCMGLLALKILDRKVPEGIHVSVMEHGAPFEIKQDPSDGSIYVANYPVHVNFKLVRMKTSLNSKAAYPLVCEYQGTEVVVFNEDGLWDDEFIEYFSTE